MKVKSKHSLASYPAVPPSIHPLVHTEKEHSKMACHRSATDASRALRSAHAWLAHSCPDSDAFCRSRTKTRPDGEHSRHAASLQTTQTPRTSGRQRSKSPFQIALCIFNYVQKSIERIEITTEIRLLMLA